MLQLLCVWPRALVFTVTLLTSSLQSNQPTSDTQPSWVKPTEFSLEVPENNTEADYIPLLNDTQINLENQTRFFRNVYKVLSQGGIKPLSQIRIEYNPSYHKLNIHQIRVFRGGEWQDRLADPSTKKTVHQGTSNTIAYKAVSTLVYVLSDIREGDIIEWSFSRTGELPLGKANFHDKFDLEFPYSLGKKSYRLLARPDFTLNIKQFNTSLQPKITDLSKTLREWKWEVIHPTPYKSEAQAPDWYQPQASIQLSENNTWQEVVQSILPYYQLPDADTLLANEEIRNLITQWMAQADTPEERALLAIRFVQDEIRYLYLDENPTDGHKPADPIFTLKNRYGDCKAKTFLLHALLNLMEIPSHVANVHTALGKTLDTSLPSPFVFNHIVLHLDIDGKTYWVEATDTLQGGTLSNSAFPNYHWALIHSPDTTGLTPIPHPKNAELHIDSQLTVKTEETAHLKTVATYYGSEADGLRFSVNKYGLKNHSDLFLSRAQKLYGDATDQHIEVQDDRQNNTFTVINTCTIPIEEEDIEIPTQIINIFLLTDINPRMQAPRAIPYPYHIKEHIEIINPFGNYEPEETHYESAHPSISYTHTMKTSPQKITWKAELQHLDDHIPQKALRKYWLDKKAIWRSTPTTFDLTDPTHN